jgi:TolB-like protein/DNA-binding winged helix-turn-helix (wHTH) protein/Tfp pilus assembly protein PilF
VPQDGQITRSGIVFRFGSYEADLGTGELRKGGLKIKLQKQSFDLLGILLERSGEVVTREELREKLWSADTFVDFDNSLNAAVSKIRQALSDSAENPRFLETLARRGYRFLTPVEKVVPQAAHAPPLADPAEVSRPGTGPPGLRLSRSARRLVLAVLGLMVAALAALLAWRWPLAERPAAALGRAPIRSLAVLPLQNLSGDAEQEYFADGMTDALIGELAHITELRVISQTSSMQYKHTRPPLAQIARELKVEALIEGTVLRSGNRVRISAQLLEAVSDRHLWAESYERNLDDILALQRDVARDIAREVRVQLTPRESALLSRQRSVKPQAYEDYLRAWPHVGMQNDEDNKAAIALLERSVAADRNFALAHAALAISYGVRSTDLDPGDKQWKERAFAAVERALSLDPDLAEAYLARARILWSGVNQFPHERTVQDLHRALSLKPSLPEARHVLANIYNHIGLLEKAADEIRNALYLDPLNTEARYRAGINLLYQGKYEESLTALRDSQRFFPSLWTFQTSFALFQLGRKHDAIQKLEAFVRDYPRDPGGQLASMQALLAADAGHYQRAREKIGNALQRDFGFAHFHHTEYIIGSTYAVMNEPALALKYLQQAADHGFPCYPLFERDPNLNNLRKDAAFVEFMSRQKKQWEYFRATL